MITHFFGDEDGNERFTSAAPSRSSVVVYHERVA